MRTVIAFVRASWLTASSYRISMIVSLLGVVGSVVPVYFVSKALQPMMAHVIRGEGGQYFAFVLIGSLTFSFLPIAVQALPNAITSSINNGTLEAVLASPTSVPAMLAGLLGYNVLWTVLRALLMLAAGAVLGASIAWHQAPAAALLLALIVFAYVPIGIITAAMYLAFRTTGMITTGVLVLSTLLGGVYYPTRVVPSWLEQISGLIPLTYGLRALRRVLLDGASLLSVRGDIGMLLLMTIVLFGFASIAFAGAFRYARRIGSLSYY